MTDRHGTAYRLTDTDEARIRAALKRAVSDRATDLAAERLAAHAIGCSLFDLRDVEREWIAGRLAEAKAAADAVGHIG